MNITATNGNIDSYIAEYAKSIVDSEYCYFLCGTNNREWYLVQSSHQTDNHYSDCFVYRLYYDTYIPNSPANTLYIERQTVQDVYFLNPQNYAYYSSDVLSPNLTERGFRNEIQNAGKVVSICLFLAICFALFNQIFRRFG